MLQCLNDLIGLCPIGSAQAVGLLQPDQPSYLICHRAVNDELSEAIRLVETRDGISKAEQIRRGLRLWLKSKGVTVKSVRKPVRTRKRS